MTQDGLLVFTLVTQASEGQYLCAAESVAGKASRHYSVYVIGLLSFTRSRVSALHKWWNLTLKQL